MTTKKVEKSNLIMKNAGDELDKMPSKLTIRYCDVMILVTSFVFTILVACFLLFHINDSQLQSASEIENIVEQILDARSVKAVKVGAQNFERKRGYLDESKDVEGVRSKRDFRSYANNGKFLDPFSLFVLQKAKFLSSQNRQVLNFSIPNFDPSWRRMTLKP